MTQVVFPDYVDEVCEAALEYWGDLPGLERIWIYTMFIDGSPDLFTIDVSSQVFFETGDAFLNSIQLQDLGDGRDSFDFNSNLNNLVQIPTLDELEVSVDSQDPLPIRAIAARDLATGNTEIEWTTETLTDPSTSEDLGADVQDRAAVLDQWIIAHGGEALNERNRK